MATGANGVSFLDFELNTAPEGGSCTVSPLTGVSMQTLFTISCTDWNDVDGVLTYQFFSKKLFKYIGCKNNVTI